IVLARLGVEIPGAYGLGDRENSIPGPFEFFLGARGRSDRPAQDVAQLETFGHAAGQLPVREGVDRQLQIVSSVRVRILFRLQLARLVIGDDDSVGPLVHTVHPARNDNVPELEPERALDVGRRPLGVDLALQEGPQRPGTLIESTPGVLFRPVSLVSPALPEYLDHLVERGRLAQAMALAGERDR